MEETIKVCSEIGRLRRVMLHRPGEELLNLMPEHLDRLLFDDIPYLHLAREEHDQFAQVLRDQGVEVVYLEDLTAEALVDESIRKQFIEDYLRDAGIRGSKRLGRMLEYFMGFSTKNMVLKMMAGVRKSEIFGYGKKNLTDYLESNYPFVIDPMPNLYFTRDPFACIGTGVALHRMYSHTRNRETLFGDYIFRYHPQYKNVKKLYTRDQEHTLEGGDILVLSPQVAAVGISQRTEPFAIEVLAKELLDIGFSQVLAIDIPKSRSFMHLDTVFTMVDRDKFTVHPNIRGSMEVFVLEKGDDRPPVHPSGTGLFGAYSYGSPGPGQGYFDSLRRWQCDRRSKRAVERRLQHLCGSSRQGHRLQPKPCHQRGAEGSRCGGSDHPQL